MKYFVDPQILYTYIEQAFQNQGYFMVRKYVGTLMFHSEESRKTFKIQNNSIYKLQFIQFLQCVDSNTVKKVNASASCVSTQLQMNYKRSLNKAIIKQFCKISFKYFRNYRYIKICISIFSCTFNSFCMHGMHKVTRVHKLFKP